MTPSAQAREAAEKILKRAFYWRDDVGTLMAFKDFIASEIAKAAAEASEKAVLAERERCRRIASEFDGGTTIPKYDWVSTKSGISERIREG